MTMPAGVRRNVCACVVLGEEVSDGPKHRDVRTVIVSGKEVKHLRPGIFEQLRPLFTLVSVSRACLVMMDLV